MVGIGFIIVTSLSILVLSALACRPIQKSWNPALNGTCWSSSGRLGFLVYQGGKAARVITNWHGLNNITAVGISCDWVLALLPIVGLWNIQLKLRKKVIVGTLMGMGVLYVSMYSYLGGADDAQYWHLPFSARVTGQNI